MKTEVIVLGKSHYKMDNGVQGAKLTVYGDYNETDFKEGIEISETDINYNEHHSVDKFPAVYSADIKMLSIKDRKGQNKTAMGFTNLKFVSYVEFNKIQETK